MLREYYTDFPICSTVKEIITDGAARGGDKRQFIFCDENGEEHEKSFREVWTDECNIGAYIRSLGVTDKMKLAILSENSYEWNAIYYTAIVNGCICVPLDARLSAPEIAHELADCECDAIFYSKSNEDKIEFVKQQEGIKLRFYFPIEKFDEFCTLGKAVSEDIKNAFLNAPVSPEDMACIVYTSGTTGRTKGVMLSHKNIVSDANASLHAITGGHGIGILPLNHTYAWVSGLFASLMRTEWGYICTNLHHVYKDIKTYKPYQFAAVPLVVEMIYKNIISTAKRKGSYEKLMTGIQTSRNFMLSGYDARREMFADIHEALGGNLEYILCGGAHLSAEIEEFMHDIGIQIITGYGLTECSPGVTCSRRYDYKMGSVGLALECNEIKINEPDADGIGEIYVKGDNIMMGYYNDPVSTAAVFDGEWFKTGDYGYIDDEGYLFFTGRKKNLIILSNGKNVSPEEIEAKLSSSIDYIKEVLVYEEKGRICGEFYLDEEQYPDARSSLKADVDEVNKSLAEFKQINLIKIRDEEFPKTTTLKIIRNYGKQ